MSMTKTERTESIGVPDSIIELAKSQRCSVVTTKHESKIEFNEKQYKTTRYSVTIRFDVTTPVE